MIKIFFFNNKTIMTHTIGYQVFYGNNLKIMFLSYFHKLWQACHGTILVEDFNKNPCRFESCQARQIDRCLGMACTTKYPTFFSSEGEYMSWATKVLWLGLRFY